MTASSIVFERHPCKNQLLYLPPIYANAINDPCTKVHHIQKAADQNPDAFPDNLVAQIAPIRHAHINMRGVISFDIRKVARGLISPDDNLQSRRVNAKPET